MKILAMVTSFGCQNGASDVAVLTVAYACGNNQLDSGTQFTVDMNQTEDGFKASIRTAVSDAVNTALGVSTTASDVLLL